MYLYFILTHMCFDFLHGEEGMGKKFHPLFFVHSKGKVRGYPWCPRRDNEGSRVVVCMYKKL